MGGHSSDVGPGRSPAVGGLQERMQDALEVAKTIPGKGDILKEPPAQEMVLEDEKSKGSAK